jgi:hypothetical protein
MQSDCTSWDHVQELLDNTYFFNYLPQFTQLGDQGVHAHGEIIYRFTILECDAQTPSATFARFLLPHS